jgi:hypothetical protein
MWLDAVDTQRHAWHVFDVWCGCTYSTAIPCSAGLSSVRDCRWENSHLPRRRFQCFPISSSVIPSRYSRTMTEFSNREAYSTARCEAFSTSSSMASCHRPHTRSSKRFDAHRGFNRSSALARFCRRGVGRDHHPRTTGQRVSRLGGHSRPRVWILPRQTQQGHTITVTRTRVV